MFHFGMILLIIYLVFKFLYIYFPLKGKKPYTINKETRQNNFAILVPAYNEENVIINCIKSLMAQNYPYCQIYIINDGSSDSTLDVLKSFLDLAPTTIRKDMSLKYEEILSLFVSVKYPNIYVIDKINGGKADALNAGISCCSEDIIVTLDADCMLKYDAISIMNKVFQKENIVAAGGTVHIIQSINCQGSETALSFKIKNTIRYQVLQYMVAFYMHKFTQSIFGSMIVISGAYGAFRRDMLIKIHGYRRTVGEDMDITLKIHQYIKSINHLDAMCFVPDSICYTECPEGLRSLVKQRIRWQKAFIDCLFEHGWKMFRKFRMGVSMFFLLDGFILGTLTSLIVFLIPLTIILHKGVSAVFLIFTVSDFFLGVAESIIAVKLAARNAFYFSRKDYMRIGWFIPFQLISYRFLSIFFIISGTLSYFFHRYQWNITERSGSCSYTQRWQE